MGIDTEQDFERICRVGHRPKTVLPSHRHFSNTDGGRLSAKSDRRDDLLVLNDEFLEINFGRYRSASCKTSQSISLEVEGKEELRRGSVYQSSREMRRMKETGTFGRRRKIEVSRDSDTASSLSILDSLCSSEEESPRKISSVISVSSDATTISVMEASGQPRLTNRMLASSLNVDIGDRISLQTSERDSVRDTRFRCEEIIARANDSNGLCKRDKAHALPKSLSAKVEMPPSPSISESRPSSRSISKVRFSPVRKMFDPSMKSRSVRSPLSYVNEDRLFKTSGMTHVREERMHSRSTAASNDFSSTPESCKLSTEVPKIDSGHAVVKDSPVHLHGFLKCVDKNGVPSFEFSLKCREGVLVAQTWKGNTAFSWLYTFHSIGGRKKSNAEGWAFNDNEKESLMVGQMQVSCYLSQELKQNGHGGNSLVTEFVLYDIAHARRRMTCTSQDQAGSLTEIKPTSRSNPRCGGRTNKIDDVENAVKRQHQNKNTSDRRDFTSMNCYPWGSAELHPDLEIAAAVIQVPYEEKGSSNYRGDMIVDNAHLNLLNASMFEQMKEQFPDSSDSNSVMVVIPTGNHGLPDCDSHGPSSLLDRWRSGGGCDCGGWDMACPLTVLSNPKMQLIEDQRLMDSQKLLELFLQGAKESFPAFTMKFVEEGHYAVDFHAHLSSLQAFFICIAMLHGSGVPSATTRQESEEALQCNSLKLLIEENGKVPTDSVAEEKKVSKIKEISPYVVNPPFSPIARV